MPPASPDHRAALFEAFQQAMEEEARLRELQVGRRRQPELWEARVKAMEATDAASRRLREAPDDGPASTVRP